MCGANEELYNALTTDYGQQDMKVLLSYGSYLPHLVQRSQILP